MLMLIAFVIALFSGDPMAISVFGVGCVIELLVEIGGL